MTTGIAYTHSKPESITSKLLKVAMSLVGRKKVFEKEMTSLIIPQDADKIPRSVRRAFSVTETPLQGRPVWRISPKEHETETVIFYIHGGGYIHNITGFHWSLIQELAGRTGAAVVVPDYPLAPEATYKEVYDYIEAAYSGLCAGTSPGNIIFMGDSAGAGLAFGFAQKLRNENKPQPAHIILLSPWLDVTMSNPEIAEADKKDRMLGIHGLKLAGKSYAGNQDTTHYQISPIYGDFRNLGRISVFIGTHDVLWADCRKFSQMMREQGIPLNYYEYPNMFHVWIAVTALQEAQSAIGQITELVNPRH